MMNPLACPVCGYERKPGDKAPLTQCPNCNVVFSKHRQAAPREVDQTEQLGGGPEGVKPSRSAATDENQGGFHPLAKRVDEKFCFECGEVIRAKAEICPKCGVRQMAASSSGPLGPTSSAGRNRIVAAIIALLLGGLGLHKFYLGQTGQGVLYLLFCWTFIPAIIAFIEGILLLLMSDQSFQAKYGVS